MSDAGNKVIRVWLETNFKDALDKRDEAVKQFRTSVSQMGPDVEKVFRTIDTQAVQANPPVKQLTETTSKLAGSAVEGTGIAGVSQQLFMAERAIGALATGQGIARAGPMLESLALALGGPAGIGFMVGAVSHAAERYIPMIINHFDLMGTKAEEALKKTLAATKKVQEEWDKQQAAKEKAEIAKAEEMESPAAEALEKSLSGEMRTQFGGAAEGFEQTVRGMAPGLYEKAHKAMRASEKSGDTAKHVQATAEASFLYDLVHDEHKGKKLVADAYAGDETAIKWLAELTGGDTRPILQGILGSKPAKSRMAMEAFGTEMDIQEMQEEGTIGPWAQPPPFLKPVLGGRLGGGQGAPAMGPIPAAGPHVTADARGNPLPGRFGPAGIENQNQSRPRFRGAQPFEREAPANLDIDMLGNIVELTQ